MSASKRRRVASPDPLAANLEQLDDGYGECIVAEPSPVQPPRSTAKEGKSTPRPRAKAQVGSASTSTPRTASAKADTASPSSARKQARTPLGKASPASNVRDNATPPSAVIPTPRRAAAQSRRSASSKVTVKPKDPPRRPTLAASLKSLPTPSPRKHLPEEMPNFDEAFADPSSSSAAQSISRDAFLANEALKRQREARNFVYEGEASAPKLTRSGKVVGKRTVEDDEEEDGLEAEDGEDLYGAGTAGAKVNVLARTQSDGAADVLAKSGARGARVVPLDKTAPRPDIAPLPPSARRHVLSILSTLTFSCAASSPPPFVDEESNEALQGLVNLLKGTVERGEGNSALVVGPRGVGKTRTVARALSLVPSTSKTSPIVVRLSGHAQTNDRLAIREMGRQIAEAEGRRSEDADEDGEEETGEDEEYAPTTLPSHLLALLTASSPRAIIIVMEEFDLFTEHARQALLYCLLDVVQSVKTGPVETTGRGVAVLGITSRIDTLLLLEKRVKSRFSHRVWRVASPLSQDGPGWKAMLRNALVPWGRGSKVAMAFEASGALRAGPEDTAIQKWKEDWEFAVDMLLDHEKVVRYLDRLSGLTTDVRNLYRPFIAPMAEVASSQLDFLSVPKLVDSVLRQVDGAGWGLQNSKLKGLSHPALGVLVIAKHLAYAGREEFNFAQVEEEYLRFSRTRLVGSGRTRWPVGVLRAAFDDLVRLSLLARTSSAQVQPIFARVRCSLSPHEIVAWFKGDGAGSLGPEMGNWGRMMGGHA